MLKSSIHLFFLLFFSYAVLLVESKDEQYQVQILSAALEVSFPSANFYLAITVSTL
jgi:hypothetical protein